ncbi:hypothetical protein RB195_003514 [Necator americanus]|uniref:Uncharacterized protein n=1 Tax=Necator americanus TaxID=51031 RepID=A0ABR1DNY3_NECAM
MQCEMRISFAPKSSPESHKDFRLSTVTCSDGHGCLTRKDRQPEIMILHISFLRKFASIRRKNQKTKTSTCQCPKQKPVKSKKKIEEKQPEKK